MAQGYRDYWLRVSPQKTLFGADQIPVYSAGFASIVSSAEDDPFTYEVPAGYVYYPSFLMVSCNQPSTHRLIISLGTNILAAAYWSGLYHVTFPESGMLPVPAGQTVYPSVENLDSITIVFFSYMIGFLQPV